jgi:hypothetical protein
MHDHYDKEYADVSVRLNIPIDKAFLVKPNKSLCHSLRSFFIHCKALNRRKSSKSHIEGEEEKKSIRARLVRGMTIPLEKCTVITGNERS